MLVLNVWVSFSSLCTLFLLSSLVGGFRFLVAGKLIFFLSFSFSLILIGCVSFHYFFPFFIKIFPLFLLSGCQELGDVVQL